MIAYVDGFNLYYGLKKASQQADFEHLRHGGSPESCIGRSLYWLDIEKMVTSLMRSNEQCVGIRYFSAMRRVPKLAPVSEEERERIISSYERQRVYIDALRTLPLVEVRLGSYIEKNPQVCPNPACRNMSPRYEEKGTDVNIATEVICDAYENRYDLAVLVSADSDLVAPLEVARRLGKQVRAALPPGRKKARHIREVADDTAFITIKHLRGMTLPDVVERSSLPPLIRPIEWRAPGGWVWRGDPPRAGGHKINE